MLLIISKPHDLVLGYSKSHKWLGCMLSASPGLDSDVEYHLQQAAKAFQKHRWMLQCKDCSIKHRLRYFEAVVSSTACLLQSTDHYTENIWRNLTFSFENLFVALWGLHRAQLGQHNGMISYMSGICAWITGPTPVEFILVKEMHDSILELRFLHCNLPAERLRRTLAWQPRPTYPPRGCPQHTWDMKLEMFCRYKAVGNWEIVARNVARWDSLFPRFLDFCSM